MIATGTNIIHPNFSTASLYVGDLNEDVTEAVLYEIFNTVGHVSSIRVCRDSVTRKSLGYAYVNYHNLADAERALDTLNYTSIKGQAARIMWSHRDPSLRKSGTGNIFVKNLDKSIDNKALFDTFSMFGNILSCKVAVDDFGKSKSYGFVHYEDEESAKEAIEKVNGIQLGSKTVYVGYFIKKSERAVNDTKYTNLYVKNFPDSVTEAHLRQLFSPFGEITSMIVKTDNKNRKFCFVNYADSENAKNAVEHLNGERITESGQIDKTGNTRDSENKGTNNNNNVSSTNTTPSNGSNNASQQNTNTTNATVTCSNSTINLDDGTATCSATATVSASATTATTSPTNNKKEAKTESVEHSNILFVGPHQSKARRHAILKAKFDNLNVETKNKHHGINLYIKNLDDAIDDQMLRELFEQYGTIASAKVMKDEKEQSKGFGFVCFASQEEANKAVTEMHLKIINGKPLYVGLAEKREQRLSRLQQKFRMHPIRHHMNNSITSSIQYANPQSPQLQFTQNTLSYGRPVLTAFNQNNIISWRHQQAAQQQAVHQQAAQQMSFNNNIRGQISQMRLYNQNNLINNNINQNKSAPQLHNQQYVSSLSNGQPTLNNVSQHNNQQLQQQQQGTNQLLNNNMRGLSNRNNRPVSSINMPNSKQLTLNINNKLASSQGNQINQLQQSSTQQQATQQQNPQQQNSQQQNTQQQVSQQQKSAQQIQQIAPNNNFKYTSQARNRMDLPNKNPNKTNPINNMNVNFNNNSTLTAAALASAPPSMQKQVLGENLFPLVANYHPTLAGKITGMMLEMDNSELLILLENEEQLKKKIDEALVVLQKAK